MHRLWLLVPASVLEAAAAASAFCAWVGGLASPAQAQTQDKPDERGTATTNDQ
jgi:hypothetical protein